MEKMKPVAVTYSPPDSCRSVVLDRFATVAEAEAYIAKREADDPVGVGEGYYGIDAPELLVNPPRVATAPLTLKSRDGRTYLAKEYAGALTPKTFANRTQAYNAAAKYGGTVIQRGRPWFVVFPDDDKAKAS